MFPERRMRRLRKSDGIRRLVRETRLTVDDLVCPVFVGEGLKTPHVIDSMPGVRRIPPDMVSQEITCIHEAGISAVMLFGIPQSKDSEGTAAYDPNGVVQNAIRNARKAVPEMVLMADVCMCQYTLSGHCGILCDGTVDNDSTIRTMGMIAVSYARMGIDIVSPSGMMDGQVATIRTALDGAGFTDVSIMSHSAKHNSAMYAPFRDAADGAPQFGDRSGYQMPYTNPREAMAEVSLDISEGADIVMIKPAMMYLDLIAGVKRRFDVPVAAYSVSGEYAMIRAAHTKGWLDGPRVMLEVLGSIKRAGADIIVTYSAMEAAELLS